MHSGHPDDQGEQVIDKRANGPINKLPPRQVGNSFVFVVNEHLRCHQDETQAVNAGGGNRKKVRPPAAVAVDNEGVDCISYDAWRKNQSEPLHSNRIKVVFFLKFHLGLEYQHWDDTCEKNPSKLHGALHLPNIDQNADNAGNQNQDVGALIPQVHQEDDLHEDAYHYALNRHVLVQHCGVTALPKLNIVLESQELEDHVQHGYYQSHNQQVRICVGKQVSHLQLLLTILTEQFCVVRHGILHMQLKTPPRCRHEVEVYL
mmetsp:Transcript_44969/g.89013  ORF Transcript_44969/g.89013 Transcript_44969/m.89013 type:complete len:260 (+) Transcript_44969:256-1035(+)